MDFFGVMRFQSSTSNSFTRFIHDSFLLPAVISNPLPRCFLDPFSKLIKTPGLRAPGSPIGVVNLQEGCDQGDCSASCEENGE